MVYVIMHHCLGGYGRSPFSSGITLVTIASQVQLFYTFSFKLNSFIQKPLNQNIKLQNRGSLQPYLFIARIHFLTNLVGPFSLAPTATISLQPVGGRRVRHGARVERSRHAAAVSGSHPPDRPASSHGRSHSACRSVPL